MHRIAFHSNTTVHLPLEDDLRLAKATGYNGIVCGYSKMLKYLQTNNQKELKKLAKDSGIAIFGIANIKVNLLALNEEVIKVVKRHARLVRAMKGNFVSITPTGNAGGYDDDEKLVAEYAAALTEVAEGAAEYGVNLAVETERPHRFLSSPVKITYIINKSGRDNIGFVFDTFAFSRAGVSMEELETIERNFYAVYLADVPEKKGLKEADRLVLGQGTLDFERILRIVHSCNYKGAFTVKLFSDARTKGRNKNLLRSARENLRAYLEILDHL